MNYINIGNYKIGEGCPPFIIAEMSGNHNQSLDRALAIVDAAAMCGVHALKLQTYTSDTMTLDLSDDDFVITDPNSLWSGSSLYELYAKAHTPWEWHAEIFNRCKEHGLLCFSSPFDETAVDFLEELNAPCYKIASFESTDIQLIRKVAETGKPMIISTGMATLSELSETVKTARTAGCKDLVLLKCTSTYPASPENTNLKTIPNMRELFDCEVGLSDHTMGIGVAVSSVVLGASIIEKHFTLKRSDGGVDSEFSMEPDEMKMLVEEVDRSWRAMGKVFYGPTRDEEKSLIYRRSLYVVKDIAEGESLNKDNIRAIRPGYGLATKYYSALLGKKARKKISRGTALHWDLVE
jgi:N-acetylneuraminate synthase